LLYTTVSLQAQSYVSLRLQMLGEMLPVKSIPVKDSIFHCTKVLQGKQLMVNYNDKNKIKHLGVSLFSRETKDLINKPVCDFIERIFLDLLLSQKTVALSKKLSEYQIDITEINALKRTPVKDLSALLNQMKEPVQFMLTHTDKQYTAIWTFENGGLEMTFPANRELIFGTNKEESDLLLNEDLSKNICSNESEKILFSVDLIDTVNDRYIRRGANFMIRQLDNDIVCRRDTDGFYPVLDNNLPDISLKNLLLLPLKSDRRMKIKHRVYGNFTPEFTLSVNDFVCFFRQEFISYCFVENRNGVLEATLVLHNQQYNFIHLLSVKIPVENWNENGILQAELFTNIPQDNIKSMF
jgi:hypothetical protein